MSLISMSELDLKNKHVILREDFNVPYDAAGNITSDARLCAALPSIQQALNAGASVILLSHCGRPEEGVFDEKLSLAPVSVRLSELLQRPVRFEKDWLEGVSLKKGEVVLCENVRFNVGEKDNDEGLARKMAQLGDVFVMDAFACVHRAQASTHGIACFAPTAVAGPLLIAEVEALSNALENPKHPLIAVVGGSKVSTKLTVLKSLLKHVDQLIVGGGIANTLLAAAGHPVGQSHYEPDLIDEAKALMQLAKDNDAVIPLPKDVLVAGSFDSNAKASMRPVAKVKENEMILDIGPQTIPYYCSIISQANTIIWNGPVGVFEFPNFSEGTKALTDAIAMNPGFSVAGGGDTIAAIEMFGAADKISYISTGGGAFLELLEGKPLPAVEVLQQRAQDIAS